MLLHDHTGHTNSKHHCNNPQGCCRNSHVLLYKTTIPFLIVFAEYHSAAAMHPPSALAIELSSRTNSIIKSTNFLFIFFPHNLYNDAFNAATGKPAVAALKAFCFSDSNCRHYLVLNDSTHRDKSTLLSLLVLQFHPPSSRIAAHMPFGTPSLHFQCLLHIFHQLFQKRSRDNSNVFANF